MSARSRPKKRQKAPPARDEETAEVERAHRRLLHLYEISKILTRFESVERTVPEILALVSEAVPLRIAIMILEERGAETRTRAMTWHVKDVSESELLAAKAHAETAYAYLIYPSAQRLVAEAGAGMLPGSSGAGFVLLPLVVDHGRIFGALQAQGAARLDEAGLMFVNAAANQLAIALDRAAAVKARQAEAEAGKAAAERTAIEAQRNEQTQRSLSETSALLAASLDYRTTLAAVVRAAVPLLADGCFIDEVSEDGDVKRLAVALADPTKQHLGTRFRQFAPTALGPGPPSQVLRSGESVLLAQIPSFQSIAQDQAHAELLEELGPQSMMCVPLVARGRTFGALTFVAAESGRRYSASDLALAEEIGARAAAAIDNAQLYERAQSAIASRNTLLAVVSHDLQNPLAAILMRTAIMLRMSPADDRMEQMRVAVVSITRCAERMKRIIADLLDIASIDAGHFSVEMAEQPIEPMVGEALEMFQAMAAQRSLWLDRDLRHAGDVVCDRGRILQVFVNLIGNAVKFTREGGSITVRAELIGHEYRFSVTDTGPGIPAEQLPHVFDRFWQAQHRGRQGTGLGLSIAKGIVEAHGGRIWVESRVGVGSAFFFTIPEVPEVPRAQSGSGRRHIGRPRRSRRGTPRCE